jgi:GH15 family glucan-1,4-alpha-glucosidase
MPRDLPLGNGSLLVAFDSQYRIRDLYWPYVGQENHATGHPFRLGFWVDGQFRWLEDEGWSRSLNYEQENMITEVTLIHEELGLELKVADAVDFHLNLLLRQFRFRDLNNQERDIRSFFHHDFHISGNETGDTAYYEPERGAIFHYKSNRWFMLNGAVLRDVGDSDPSSLESRPTLPGLKIGVHQWACGLKEIHNFEGTWRDAEDGELSGGAVAHGSVDSTVGFNLQLQPGGEQTLYYWMAVGSSFDEVVRINRLVRQRGPEAFLKRTRDYWHLWLMSHRPDMTDLDHTLIEQYLLSLLVVRTQVDNQGAIIAANDSDISSSVRDTYSYMWPRDGALVANALNQAGHIDLPRAFFRFCEQVLTREGYLLHKFNPDGTLASSWHPWYRDGVKDLPIQEDETALVLWALWEHFDRFKDVEFIKPLYRTLIIPAADFLDRYRDSDTGLPLPSYDLWEERRGILTWTVASVWGGLTAAEKFAQAFGDQERADRYHAAAVEVKAGTEAHLWQPELNRFVRMINPSSEDGFDIDPVIDASMIGLWKFGMYPADSPQVKSTMESIRERLWVKTEVGGVARYENDGYHQVSEDVENVPGNPWFICTLWLAEWYAWTANSKEDLDRSRSLLDWVAERALPSGVLAEQVHPYTNAPLSVSPLTWSHATFITAVQAYLQAIKRLA